MYMFIHLCNALVSILHQLIDLFVRNNTHLCDTHTRNSKSKVCDCELAKGAKVVHLLGALFVITIQTVGDYCLHKKL
jgi:hypothetical protein